jgi:hypothetical protein
VSPTVLKLSSSPSTLLFHKETMNIILLYESKQNYSKIVVNPEVQLSLSQTFAYLGRYIYLST